MNASTANPHALIEAAWPNWVLVPTRKDSNKTKAGWDARKIPQVRNWQTVTETPSVWPNGAGAFLLCGAQSGVCVIDLDDLEAPSMADWEAYVEEHEPLVAVSRRGKGFHIFVEYHPDIPHRLVQKVGFDIRTDGGGVKLPGDPMEASGPFSRSWHEDTPIHNARLGPAAPALAIIEKWLATQATTKTITGRSPLADLLAHPPEAGSRNDWLARVAGHYVKHLPYEDMFHETLALANRALPEPLSDEEVTKTVATQWERYKQSLTPEGYDGPIAMRDGHLHYVHKDKDGDVPMRIFSLPVEFVSKKIDAEGHLTWQIVFEGREHDLPGRYLTDGRKLDSWLMSLGLVTEELPTRRHIGYHLGKYLKACDLPTTVEAPHWGWYRGEWVGLGESVGPSAYHMAELGEYDGYQDIMRQMATWQSDVEAAVFLSWVAAQAVKGLVEFGLEPNLVLKGRSGSGKTRGLFGFAARLTGSPGTAAGTLPVVRDMLAQHKNGIVVIDDVSDTRGYEELYRQSAQNSVVTKKTGANYADTSEFPLLGSMLFSGEALSAFSTDKALVERTIGLEIQGAQDRRSLIHPDRPQWEDIVAVFEELGGHDERAAYNMAASFIKACLAAPKHIGIKPSLSSRRGAAGAMIEYGARVYDWAAGGDVRTYEGHSLVELADLWAADLVGIEEWQKTTILTRILPAAIIHEESDEFIWWDSSNRDERTQMAVHLQRLEAWWREHNRFDPRALELGSIDNMRREMALLQSSGASGKSRQHGVKGRNLKAYRLSRGATALVMAIAGMDGDAPIEPQVLEMLGEGGLI